MINEYKTCNRQIVHSVHPIPKLTYIKINVGKPEVLLKRETRSGRF